MLVLMPESCSFAPLVHCHDTNLVLPLLCAWNSETLKTYLKPLSEFITEQSHLSPGVFVSCGSGTLGPETTWEGAYLCLDSAGAAGLWTGEAERGTCSCVGSVGSSGPFAGRSESCESLVCISLEEERVGCLKANS